MLFKPAGLDEYEWAKRAGVNRGYFNDIKEKKTSPRTETLTQVLAVAGKTVADLYLADAGLQPALVNPPFTPHDLPRDVPIHGTAMGGSLEVRRSKEHMSELQLLMRVSHAVFCMNKT